MKNIEFTFKVVEDTVINELEFVDVITSLGDSKINVIVNEGPDLGKIKLFGRAFLQGIEMLCKNLKIEKNQISFTTYNLVQQVSAWPNIKIIHPPQYFLSAANLDIEISKQIVKHFGIFIGGSRWHRLHIAASMFANHKDKLLISYWQHHFNKKQPANLYIDDMLMKLHHEDNGQKIYDEILYLIKNLPLHLGANDTVHNKNVGYINWDKAFEILPYYNNIFVDVVCETWHNGICFLPTEKSARPIASKTPFITYAGKHFLKNMKKLGFQTFDRWWSETYDDFEGVQRIQRMLKEIDKLAKKTLEELKDLYTEMMPVLEHNVITLRSLNKENIIEKMK